MNYLSFTTLLLIVACTTAQPTADPSPRKTTLLVSFKVFNNSVLVHKYTLIGYNPGETGNWTNSFVLLPGVHRTYECPVGTKIYQADGKQIETVMGGGSIRNDEPFITVKAEDEGKSFKLND